MDTFEELQKKWAGLPVAKQMELDDAKKGVCMCPKCPTYTGCAKNAQELLFCMKGKSFMCITHDKGCLCPDCPVTKEYGLKNKSFCMKGAEKAQRYERTIWGSKM